MKQYRWSIFFFFFDIHDAQTVDDNSVIVSNLTWNNLTPPTPSPVRHGLLSLKHCGADESSRIYSLRAAAISENFDRPYSIKRIPVRRARATRSFYRFFFLINLTVFCGTGGPAAVVKRLLGVLSNHRRIIFDGQQKVFSKRAAIRRTVGVRRKTKSGRSVGLPADSCR